MHTCNNVQNFNLLDIHVHLKLNEFIFNFICVEYIELWHRVTGWIE